MALILFGKEREERERGEREREEEEKIQKDMGGDGFFDQHTLEILGKLKRGERKRRRREKSKWGREGERGSLVGVPSVLSADLEGKKLTALMTRIRIDEITMRLNCLPIKVHESESRSPSPPPSYNLLGKRANTREARIKENLARERMSLVQEAKKMNPFFRPPPNFKPLSIKKRKKIYIPWKEYPDYNFIGLIIGPRGRTQKQMEKETGTKISIRGKGSAKKNKTRSKEEEEEEDELHVLIVGETKEQVQKASLMIEKLLIPVEDRFNVHKHDQLRELAKIHGVENFWTRPSLSSLSQVACAHCGEMSHISIDCPFKDEPGFLNRHIDHEYQAFLAEIGEKTESPVKPPPIPSSTTGLSEEQKQKEYENFMSSINNMNNEDTTTDGQSIQNFTSCSSSSSSSAPPWKRRRRMGAVWPDQGQVAPLPLPHGQVAPLPLPHGQVAPPVPNNSWFMSGVPYYATHGQVSPLPLPHGQVAPPWPMGVPSAGGFPLVHQGRLGSSVHGRVPQ